MRKQFQGGALALLLLAACGFSSCGEEEEVVTQDNLPYGATLTVDKENHLLPVQYDSRFVTEEILDVVLKYYDAVQKQDDESFEAVQLPLFHEYQLGTVLGGKYTDADLLRNSHQAFSQALGSDFEFSLIDITGFEKSPVTPEGDRLPAFLDNIAEELNEPAVSSDITEDYALTVTSYIAKAGEGIKGETNDYVEDETLYVLEYQGEWYILYT